MILKIKSNNKYLLDLLYKNPNTDNGLYFKPLKNGVIVGNAVNANYYEVVFQDTKYSYLPEESNQIDFQNYCNPLVVLQICNELFSHILKDKATFENQEISWLNTTQGKVDNEVCSIEIPTFYIHSNWYRNGEFLLAKYFPGISVQHQVGRNFKLTITGKNVFEAFNLLNLMALFTHITNEYGMFTFITEDFALKYVRILTNLNDVPYFVFYLFIKRAVKTEKQFLAIKPIFEEYLSKKGITANLTYYGTHQDRVRFISNQLEKDIPILDVGCGELIYYKRMMNLNFNSNYYAIDTDVQFEKKSHFIAQKFDADNLHFYTSLNDFTSTEKVNILLTEVIEHNSLEDAETLIKQLLTFNFNQLIISTPNDDFNKFYFDDESMRHDEHHFELNQTQFKNLISECIGDNKNYDISYHQIGDSLNGIQPTQAVIIKNIIP
jgi:hypothetical protein